MYEDEGYRLMGAAFEVFNQLGYGMAEEVYQQCLEIELGLRSIPFSTKKPLTLSYKGCKIEKQYIPDLMAWDVIAVELKAVKELLPEHEAQLFNYMRISQRSVGYLINFGRKSKLEWKRYVLSDLYDPN
ncbi:MAG: GxxExxY protein [Planctomycetota bacterium]|nr:GxxExxY protein [Planctomycetota bacterium]MDA0919399.1 GxxExxY protein [Planctomycetota bacterium]MDA1160726.1 GxxExxY protein [Planctomycetota bacterium]